MEEVAKLPRQRKLWLLRKIYGGNGGVLPPTDPRLFDLTEEQMNLDLMHYKIDHPDKFREVFIDSTFEDYVADVEADNKKASEERKELPAPQPEEWRDIPDEELDKEG